MGEDKLDLVPSTWSYRRDWFVDRRLELTPLSGPILIERRPPAKSRSLPPHIVPSPPLLSSGRPMSLPSRLGASKRSTSHLLLAGHNLLAGATASSAAPSQPTLAPVPFGAWLGSIGRAEDVHHGWQLLPSALASGQGHSLVGYRSLGVDRCFGVGRNESAQLGAGFASHEGTRGLVEGFEVSNHKRSSVKLNTS